MLTPYAYAIMRTSFYPATLSHWLRYLLLFAVLMWATQGLAQQEIQALNSIKEQYERGQLAEAWSGIATWMSKYALQANNKSLTQAYQLEAKIAIAQDDLPQAQLSINRLMEVAPAYVARFDDPVVFRELVALYAVGGKPQSVSSVSRVAESIYEAPSTVMVLSAEEIKERGYQDLEQLLHDLPGFDISQSNGVTYASIYQRGYRSPLNTDRMLLLVDGVEENDLWGNIVYLSRQYPITNISSVEVVYGPASNIYGPNAYVGVINIITKSPHQLLTSGGHWGASAMVSQGTWNTQSVDVTLSSKAKEKPIGATLTARWFRSDEPNYAELYPEADWLDYTLPRRDAVLAQYAERFQMSDTAFARQRQALGEAVDTTMYVALNDSTIGLSPKGLNHLWHHDSTLYDQLAYGDRTEALALHFKANVYDFTFGAQYWHKREGLGAWFSEQFNGTVAQGQSWNPRSFFVYGRYDKRLNEEWEFTAFSRFKQHGYLPDNALTRTFSYYAGRGLTLLDAVQPDRFVVTAPSGGRDTLYFNTSYYNVASNQFRNNLTLYFRDAERPIQGQIGIEHRASSIQTNYNVSASPTRASEFITNAAGHVFSQNIGVFSQASWRIIAPLRLTGGLRLDYHTLSYDERPLHLSPRVSLVYQRGAWVYKAMYASAFKTPTNLNLYSSVQGQRARSDLRLNSENVNNYEVSIRRRGVGSQPIEAELVAYHATYSDIITSAADSAGNTIYINSSTPQKVIGGHLTLSGQVGKSMNWYANYTLTEPYCPEGATMVRVADIASHQWNAGLTYRYKSWRMHLRTQVVGRRPSGAGTSVPQNPHYTPNPDPNAPTFQTNYSYHVTHGVLSYEPSALSGLAIDLAVNNLFNQKYYAPGVRTANDVQYSASLPQRTRNLHLRLRFDW